MVFMRFLHNLHYYCWALHLLGFGGQRHLGMKSTESIHILKQVIYAVIGVQIFSHVFLLIYMAGRIIFEIDNTP